MRNCDQKLTDAILESVFTFMQAQTDPRRKDIRTLHAYLEYRERDVGRGYVRKTHICELLHVSKTETEQTLIGF
jgi:aristolochene synthase